MGEAVGEHQRIDFESSQELFGSARSLYISDQVNGQDDTAERVVTRSFHPFPFPFFSSPFVCLFFLFFLPFRTSARAFACS